MKNITVSLDDETYRRARILAAEQGASVSALVRRFLTEVAAGGSESQRLQGQENELRQRIGAFRARDRLERDEFHRR
ncbi:MAG TPA: DUF6364 family protein [Caulobacteraceae bacterium]|nr:DUF6364 family protein [Caulobacteraceae bacterium]